ILPGSEAESARTWVYAYQSASDDSVGLLMAKDDPNSFSERLQSVQDGATAGRLVEYDLDNDGGLDSIYHNQVFSGDNRVSWLETDYAYDVDPGAPMQTPHHTHYWLTKMTTTYHGTSGTQVLTQNDYTYDQAGNRQTNLITSDDASTRTEAYGYDKLYRLKT